MGAAPPGVDLSRSTGAPPDMPPLIDDRCSGGEQWNFSVHAIGLSGFEGRTVWASVVGLHGGGQPTDSDKIIVLMHGRIQGGELDLHCARGIPSFTSPFFAVVIDADGSGDCSQDDRILYSDEWFGIGTDVVLEGRLTSRVPSSADGGVFHFCRYFFDLSR